ncbi:hypothetical protein HPT25_05430 [Bacillus sp. BRMEA1]|uniref:hypothetical protein n=1 Tax=Neobacillus endophyticus TaxID=2738405 RepID=UPI001563BC41|nr:hypothetical protein [Neobacillus endophyticus]NRD76934.1 hypothetical protein [Neobacillus endophyticus]
MQLNKQGEFPSLNGTVYITSFTSFTEAVNYCLTNNKILDLCATTITADPSYNGMQLCSIKNGTIILNDYVRFYVGAYTVLEDSTFIDNFVYSKTTSVPANFDQVTLGWVIESLNGSSDNVVLRRVNSYSTNQLTSDGNYRTRGFINLKGNNIVMDECNINDCRNAVRMGVNTKNVPQWSNILLKNCRFKNVEQCIDLLNVSQVRIQNCLLLNTDTQQANYTTIKGADFICSISSDDIYVSDIKVERPVERTIYIVNSKRFHLNRFNISYGGLGDGGGLKIVGWGSDETFMSVDCIIENGFCGTTAGEYFDFYGVSRITIRNVTTTSGGSGKLVLMCNRNRHVYFENVRASVTGCAVYAYSPSTTDLNTNDNGIELTNFTLKNCTITCTSNTTNYLITATDDTGGKAQYTIFDTWTILDSNFNLNPSINSTKYIFSFSNFGTITNIKIKNITTNSNFLSLYDFTSNTNVQHYANTELTGRAKTNHYMYGIDFPNVINFLPLGSYSLDLVYNNLIYGKLIRENSGNIIYRRTFNAAGTEYILRRVQGNKTLNFKVIFEIGSDTFSTKFLLSSNGSTLSATLHYGSIISSSNYILLPNNDQLQLDQFSFPSSLRYMSSAGAKVDVKMTILSVTYV